MNINLTRSFNLFFLRVRKSCIYANFKSAGRSPGRTCLRRCYLRGLLSALKLLVVEVVERTLILNCVSGWRCRQLHSYLDFNLYMDACKEIVIFAFNINSIYYGRQTGSVIANFAVSQFFFLN